MVFTDHYLPLFGDLQPHSPTKKCSTGVDLGLPLLSEDSLQIHGF